MNEIKNQLLKEFSIYSIDDLSKLAQSTYNFSAAKMNHHQILDKIISIELTNWAK